MALLSTSSYRTVELTISCQYCKGQLYKHGKSGEGKQRFRCRSCGKTQLAQYSYNAYDPKLNQNKGNNNDWIFPWTIGVENYEIDSELILKSEYRSYSSGYFGIGRTAIKHFKNNFYFNLSASIVLGTEKLTDYSSARFNRILVGMTTSQGLLYIPKSKYGVVFGAGVFEKAFTSKIYSFDLGLQLSIGVKF